MEKQIAGEIDWDVEAVKGSKESWKDEYLTILFSIPLLLCFLPWTVEYVERGFSGTRYDTRLVQIYPWCNRISIFWY